MIIPINSDNIKFFRQFIGLLSNFPPIKGLRPREMEVLAEVVRQYYLYRKVEEDLRHAAVFSVGTRKIMREHLNISEDVLNNNLSILRKAGVITKDNQLLKILRISPETHGELTFKFKINE